MGRGIFSMRKLIEGNLKPFGFMKVSHTSKVIESSFSPLKSCLPTLCVCKTDNKKEMFFRAMLWFVWPTAGSQADTFLLLLREARYVCKLLIALSVFFVILVESDKYWIRKKCKYQSDDETCRFVQDFQGKISFVTRRFCFLRTQSWKRQLLWKS